MTFLLMNHDDFEETDTLPVCPSCVEQLENGGIGAVVAGNLEVLLGEMCFVTRLQHEPCCNNKLVVKTHEVGSSDSQRERWDQLKERHSQKNRLLSVADS